MVLMVVFFCLISRLILVSLSWLPKGASCADIWVLLEQDFFRGRIPFVTSTSDITALRSRCELFSVVYFLIPFDYFILTCKNYDCCCVLYSTGLLQGHGGVLLSVAELVQELLEAVY